MIMKLLISALLFALPILSFCQTVSGVVKDTKGNILPYASILVKGTTKGTTSNAKGLYTINIEKGKYILVCQRLGYATKEAVVNISSDVELNFTLEDQQYKMNEVIVKSGAEDPAYAIIRKAIATREEHENDLKKFEAEVYIKGQLQLRNYPKKFFGEAVDFEDGDTSKKKMIFLSETVAKYSVNNADRKIEVVSTKVSGNSNGFGFSSPQMISFYKNIVSVGNGLNPRGFISPLANNALNFYRYKFKGTFFENGKEVSRIQVIPKRKYEPLFTGFINIIENEWRLQSVQLTALKEQQMQLLDTLQIEQLFVPFKDTWIIKQQVIQPAGKFFSFDFFGSFVQVYSKFNTEPVFDKKFFNNTILKFYDSSNKKTLGYWDSIRPIPLLDAEVKDYKKKDSLEIVRKSPKYLDSLDKVRNKITFSKLILTGQSFSIEKKKVDISIDPFLKALNSYNTVEGYVINFSASYFKRFKEGSRNSLLIAPTVRYGFSNRHFNGYLTAQYNYGKKYSSSVSLSGGSKVFQFNNASPIAPSSNTISTLLYERNYLKIYQAAFARIGYSKALGDGFSFSANIQFQDRIPLVNTTDYKAKDFANRSFTPNYPIELPNSNFIRHQALSASINVTFRPGSKYIEFPNRKVNIGSKYPTLRASIIQGVNGILGSDVNYTKWKFTVDDNLNLKLGGRFSYKLETGGFLNAKSVFSPDYNHFLGNQTAVASQYLNSFQLLPYYQFSNIEKAYGAGHIEYHLSGLLTNKIPGFRKLNWFLVAGANGLYINNNKNYYEAFIGLENIFKIIRVDYIQGFQNGGGTLNGIRFSMPLLFGSGGDGN